MKKETLYAYVRVSTEEQFSKDYSIPRQKDLAKKKAQELNMKCEIFEEEGSSASQENFDNRPQIIKLLNLVKEGEAKNIFVFDQTRLSRNDITKGVITNEFKKHGVQLFTASKKIDFEKSEDRLTFSILQAMEDYESSLRKARFAIGYVSGNQKGKFLKNITPYGYMKTVDNDDKSKHGFLVVDPEEKKILLKLVDLYLNHNYGTNSLAKWLNENNIPTKTSKILKKGYKLKAGSHNRKETTYVQKNSWNPGTVNMILQNPIYLGKRRFKTGKDSYEFVDVEPILDKETWDRIQAKRKENVITKHKEDKYFYLLKGLIQCGKCGRPMHGRIKPNRGENTYICNSKRDITHSCGSRGINIDKLNSIVWNSFRESLAYHEAIKASMEKQMAKPNEIKGKLVQLNKDLEKHNSDKKKIEEHIKMLLSNMSGKVKQSILEETIADLNKKIKLIDDNILSTNYSIKTLSQRVNKTASDKSEFLQGIHYYINAKKRLAELGAHQTKENLLEAQKLFRQSIENIVVTWDEKKNEHSIEILFYKIVEGKQKKNNVIRVGLNEKVKKIGFYPMEPGNSTGDWIFLEDANLASKRSRNPKTNKATTKISKTQKGGKNNSSPSYDIDSSLIV